MRDLLILIVHLITTVRDSPDSRPVQSVGQVIAIPEVGGLHHRYERHAAWSWLVLNSRSSGTGRLDSPGGLRRRSKRVQSDTRIFRSEPLLSFSPHWNIKESLLDEIPGRHRRRRRWSSEFRGDADRRERHHVSARLSVLKMSRACAMITTGENR